MENLTKGLTMRKQKQYGSTLVFFLMLFHALLQIASLFVTINLGGFFLLIQEIVFFLSLIIFYRLILKETQTSTGRKLIPFLLLFFSINLFLFFFWYKTLANDPEINWRLQEGRNEEDTTYYIMYLPVINFLFFLLTIAIFFLHKTIRRIW